MALDHETTELVRTYTYAYDIFASTRILLILSRPSKTLQHISCLK